MLMSHQQNVGQIRQSSSIWERQWQANITLKQNKRQLQFWECLLTFGCVSSQLPTNDANIQALHKYTSHVTCFFVRAWQMVSYVEEITHIGDVWLGCWQEYFYLRGMKPQTYIHYYIKSSFSIYKLNVGLILLGSLNEKWTGWTGLVLNYTIHINPS
jgi:hypothetical protein